MNNEGITTQKILTAVFGIIVLGGVAYLALNPKTLQAPIARPTEEAQTATTTEPTIEWHFASAGDVENTPYTKVTVAINGASYDMGKFAGSCSQVDANGGIDGKGLLAGELSAAQCWFAGGGNEIGVFASEDGGTEIMVGELSEGEEGSPLFRGSFSIKNSISL